jgi:hypothetical protein
LLKKTKKLMQIHQKSCSELSIKIFYLKPKLVGCVKKFTSKVFRLRYDQ